MSRQDGKIDLISKTGMDRHFKANNWYEYNREMFDMLADKYDRANNFLALGTKHKMDRTAIKRVPIKDGDRVIDICTGTGDISTYIANRFPSSNVVGIDASVKMMAHAREKSKKLKNISFITGDAMKLPFADNSFDVAIISFGLRNLIDIEAGIKEMQRVVRPGGFVCNIDQGKPKNPLLYRAYHCYFHHLVPAVGKLLFHRKEYNSLRYLPESNDYFPRQDELVQLMGEVGLKDVKNYDFMFGAIAQQVARV